MIFSRGGMRVLLIQQTHLFSPVYQEETETFELMGNIIFTYHGEEVTGLFVYQLPVTEEKARVTFSLGEEFEKQFLFPSKLNQIYEFLSIELEQTGLEDEVIVKLYDLYYDTLGVYHPYDGRHIS